MLVDAAGSPGTVMRSPEDRSRRRSSVSASCRGEREPGENPGLSRSGKQERPPFMCTGHPPGKRRPVGSIQLDRVPASPKTCRLCRARRARRSTASWNGRVDLHRTSRAVRAVLPAETRGLVRYTRLPAVAISALAIWRNSVTTTFTSTVLGSPRIGPHRELKRATESYWAGRIDADALQAVARDLRWQGLADLRDLGLDSVPVNTFSFYDQMLDTAVLLGALPDRVASVADPLDRYFAAARGTDTIAPLEMTKWFDTNYHYLVPEISPSTTFALDPSKVLSELAEALSDGIAARPVVIGPVTFLLLSKLSALTSRCSRDSKNYSPSTRIYSVGSRRPVRAGFSSTNRPSWAIAPTRKSKRHALRTNSFQRCPSGRRSCWRRTSVRCVRRCPRLRPPASKDLPSTWWPVRIRSAPSPNSPANWSSPAWSTDETSGGRIWIRH